MAAQNAVPPREVGTTTGAIAFFRGLAGAVVVAVFSAILLNGLGFSVTEGHGAEFLAKMNAVAAVTAARAFAYVYLAAGLLFLVAAVAGGAATKGLIGAEAFAALGEQGYFINVARGTVVLKHAGESRNKHQSVTLLEAIEEHVVLLKLLGEATSGLTVRIGAETGLDSLLGTAVVSTAYGADDQALATLGTVGPTRMDYPGTIASVAATK